MANRVIVAVFQTQNQAYDAAAAMQRLDDDGMIEFLVYRPRPVGRGGFRILRTDRGFRVTGSTPGPDELEAALRAAGAKTGAQVEVDGETLILS